MGLHQRLILLLLLASSFIFLLGAQVESQALPVVEKSRTTLYPPTGTDSYGWRHVFGEVENPSGGENRTISVTVAFLAGYGLLKSESAYTMIDLVTKGKNASFDVILANSTLAAQVTDYSISVTSTTRSNTPYRSFTNTTQPPSVDSQGRYHMIGTITNTGLAKANFIQVIATFYDSSNRVVYANWTYSSPMNLSASDQATFEIIALNKSRIVRTSLQAQCTEYVQYPTTDVTDFALRVTPPLTQSSTQGDSRTYYVRTVPSPKMNYSVNFVSFTATGLPQGSTATFSPSNSVPVGTRVNLTITTSSTIGVGIGNFLIRVSASGGGLGHAVPVILTVSAAYDFTLSISPSSRSVSQGNQAIYTITATSGGGFSSPVTLNYSNIPTGSTAEFSTNPITPTPTGVTTTFRISTSLSTALGTKVFSVCGRGGSPEKSHCATAIVAVTASTAPSFSLSMTPDERTVLRDSSTNFTVTVTSVNDFDESVTLKLTGNPSGTSGTFSPNPVTPPGSGTVQSTLNITTTSAPLYGTYTITVNGTSSGFPSSLAQATLIVSSLSEPDFALYVFPSTLSIVQNKSGTATIQIVSVNNFEGSVTLTLQGIPTGVTHSFANPTVAPLPGGYVNTKLTLQTSSSTSLGNYTLTLKGSGSSKNHTASLVLFVTSGARCIIATATYGSELSPEVQFLRGFRDNRVLSTSGGREFMKVFNAWYYSFSPQVASWIAGNPSAREPFKMLLMPLLGILHLSEISYSTVAFAPEIAVILAGIVASSLIGVVYLGPILAVTCRRMSYKSRRRLLDWATLASAVSISLLAIGLLTSTPLLVMLTSSLLVLSTVTIGSWSVPIAASRILDRCRKTTV